MSNWFTNFFNLNPRIEQPPLNYGFIGLLEGKKKILNEDFLEWYKTNPFVFTAISERAKAVANCKFYIKTKDDEYIQNSLTEKLNEPNKYSSKNEFIIQLMTYKSIWGTSYTYFNKIRRSEDISNIDIVNLPTNQILFGDKLMTNYSYDFIMDMLKRNDDSKVRIYYYGVDNVETKELEKDYLMPLFDTPIFTNPYYSESRLKSQRYVVSNIQAALESQNTFLSTPGGMGMLMPDTKDASGMSIPLRPEEKSDVETQLQNDYGSLTGQKNIRMLNAPVKYQETMVDISKLKINDTIVQNALILFGAFGLPKEVLTAMMKGDTFENQREAYKNFIQSSAQTEIDSICNSIDTLNPSKEGELVAKYDHLPIMQEDEEKKSKVHKTESESLKLDKEVYDDWLSRGLINEKQYKEYFKL